MRDRGSRWRNTASKISVGRSVKDGDAIVGVDILCICRTVGMWRAVRREGLRGTTIVVRCR
jgi:hypothetical protein